MPIYEYKCQCGAKYERIQPFDAPTCDRCECGALAPRVLAPSSFRMGKTNGKPGMEDLPPAGQWV